MTQPKSAGNGGAPPPGDALAAALARLIADSTLTPEQAATVAREYHAGQRPAATAPAASTTAARSPWALLLAEIGGYVGGAFVLGAATILLSDNWHQLGATARVVTLAVPAALLIAGAVVTARTTPGGWRARAEPDPVAGVGSRRRLVSVLVSVATVLAGGATAVLVDAGHRSGDWMTFAFSWTSLVIAGAAYAACRTELLHTMTGIGAAAAAIASLRVTGWYGERSTGWAFVAVGVAWGAATLCGLLAERGLGFGWGGVLIFVGAELLTTTDPPVLGYAALTLLAVAGFAGFSWGRSLTLLVIGVATLAVLVPQAVIDATDGALNSSGALLVAGLSIVGASALGFRLHRAPPTA